MEINQSAAAKKKSGADAPKRAGVEDYANSARNADAKHR